MNYYLISKQHPNDFTNGCKSEDYLCSLTMKASALLDILLLGRSLQKSRSIDSSKENIEFFVKELEEYFQNSSYYRLVTRDYKTMLTIEDLNDGLVELLAVFYFLLEDPTPNPYRIRFVEKHITEWSEKK